jgi:hypothetical protein
MGRLRNIHVQTSLRFRRLDKNGQYRGGPNPNAGRKRSDRSGVSHATRPEIDPRFPQHISLRVHRDLGGLRKLDTYTAIRRAMRVSLRGHAIFRIIHISVQNTHIHLICEATNKAALSAGLQGFQISAAKQLNAVVSVRRRLPQRRRGRVFTDRYHAESLKSPTQVRNAINYVVNNWRHHRVDRDAAFTLLGGRIDPYASGCSFAGWRAAIPTEPVEVPYGYETPPVSEPATWLARVGWQKVAPIGMFDVPGPRKVPFVDA